MITEKPTRDIQRSANFKEKKFSIKTTAKSYRILSNKLYSDKIQAIIRELSTNAFDAQVTAGNPEAPFEVHLPNRFEPFFSIRDFGTGLSVDDVENIYTTYFESTKDEDPDQIGCLGLGSKSPICYVKIFTVVSYFEGMKYTFSAFLDEEEAPSIALVSSLKTDEPNGLKVQLDVQQQEFTEFQYKAERVYRYFKVQPKFSGKIPYVQVPQYSVKRKNWGICTNRKNTSRPYAIMGQVAYPVDIDLHDLSSLERLLLAQLPIDMYFKIGDLDFAPSREALSYDEKTIKMIRDRVTEILDFEKKRFLDTLEDKETFWEACLFVMDEVKDNPLIKAMVGEKNLSWKGRDINPCNNYIHFATDEFRKKLEDNTYVSKIKIFMVRKKETRNGYTITRPETAERIPVSRKNVLFINDLERGSYTRARTVLKNNPALSRVYYIDVSKKKVEKKFRKRIGKKTVPALSSIPKPVIVRKPRGEGTKNFAFKWYSSYSGRCEDSWDELDDEFDINEGGFYVPILHWKVDGENPSEFVRPLLAILKDLGHTALPTVYGVKTAKVGAFKKMSNWVLLEEFVDMEVSKVVKDPDFLHTVRLSYFRGNSKAKEVARLINAMKTHDDSEDIRDNKFYKKCKSGKVRRIARDLQRISEGTKSPLNSARIRNRLNVLNITVPQVDLYCGEIEEFSEKTAKRFPLLGGFNYSSETYLNHVIDYINGIEAIKS